MNFVIEASGLGKQYGRRWALARLRSGGPGREG